jgi:transcriptional regulator with XRE-family HTH domain
MLGKKLRELRDRAGLTATETAGRAEISTGRLSRIENGEVAPDIPLAKYLLDLYLIPVNEWEPYLEQVRAARKGKGWWQAYGIVPQGYTAHETAACSQRTFELVYIPGLLQTEAYARAGFSRHAPANDKDWVENKVRVRMIRQRRLTSVDDRIDVAAVIDHAALVRPVGAPEIMHEQLRHLIQVAAAPNVSLRIVPADRVHYLGMDGAFTILSFPGVENADLAFIHNVAGPVRLDKPAQVRACALAFEQVSEAALQQAESITYLEKLVADFPATH